MFKQFQHTKPAEISGQPGLEYWFRERRTIVDFRRGPLEPHFDGFAAYALSDFFETSDEDWERMFNINVWSGVRLTRTYMKSMLQRGRGRVIFISSEVALTPMAAMAHYSASKATQLSISRSLAELTKGTAVTVNSVLPGPTETENLKAFIKSVNPDSSLCRSGAQIHARKQALIPDLWNL